MPDVTFQFDPMRVGREMHEIEAWLQRAGLEPGDVPTDARVVFSSDGTMTIDVHLREADGSKYVIEDTVARGTATVPLLMPPYFEALVAIPAAPAGESYQEVAAAPGLVGMPLYSTVTGTLRHLPRCAVVAEGYPTCTCSAAGVSE